MQLHEENKRWSLRANSFSSGPNETTDFSNYALLYMIVTHVLVTTEGWYVHK